MCAANRFIILMYHEIGDVIAGTKPALIKMQSSYYVEKNKFEGQMRYLHEEKFNVISLKDLLIHLNGWSNQGLPEKTILITFDDGHKGNYKYAFPVLMRYGFCATFFCTSSYIGEASMLTWEEIKAMVDAGMSVQSHTLTHPFLKQLGDEEVRRELGQSKKIIEGQIGEKVEFISLPHGSYGRNYRRIAEEEGFMAGCSSIAGINGTLTDRYLLRRIHVSGEYNLREFSRIVNNEDQKILWLSLKKNVKTFIRNMLGERFYYVIYKLVFGLKNSATR